MSDTQILWSYPCVFHRIKRVDAKYAYLVVNDGYIPLRRREGCLSVLWKYEAYTNLFSALIDCGMTKYKLILETLDEISSFFQMQMEDEYLLEEEYDISAYGKMWEEMFDEMYSVQTIDAVRR